MKEVALAHGGIATADAQPGGGLTVTVKIPTAHQPVPPLTPAMARAGTAATPGGGRFA